MRDQIAPAHAAFARIVQQTTHHIELVVAWPDLCLLLLPTSLLVPDLNDLGVVLEDVRHACPGQHLAPQVAGLDAIRVPGRNPPSAVRMDRLSWRCRSAARDPVRSCPWSPVRYLSRYGDFPDLSSPNLVDGRAYVKMNHRILIGAGLTGKPPPLLALAGAFAASPAVAGTASIRFVMRSRLRRSAAQESVRFRVLQRVLQGADDQDSHRYQGLHSPPQPRPGSVAMNATSFDTLAAADRLRDAGFDDGQARAIVEVHRAAGEQVATKADLAELRADIYRALWIQGIGIVAIVGGVIAIAAALKLFP